MWKRLAVLTGIGAVLAAAVIFVTCKDQTPCNKNSKQSEGKTLISAVVVNSPAHDKESTKEGNNSSNCVSCRQKLLAWPEGITVWAVLLTMLVIGWQSWETSLSAKAMRDSIRLQQAGMQQWVDIRFWHITTTDLSKKPNSKEIATAGITIGGRVINPTPLPLTLDRIEMSISRALEWETFTDAPVERVPPSKNESDGYRFCFGLKLTEDQTTRLLSNEGLMMSVGVKVDFREAAGPRRTQNFPAILQCSSDEVRALEFVGEPLKAVEAKQKTTEKTQSRS